MAVSQAELRRRKVMAQLLLEANGVDHDTWLAEQYDEVIRANDETIQKALKQMVQSKQKNHSNYNT